MANKFSSGKNSIAECDRCGQRYKLRQLKELVIKTKRVNILVCPECWEPDQPQLSLGLYPVEDPQAVRNPRPDNSYVISGLLANGYPGEGSRDLQWGWSPVGGASGTDTGLTLNYLVATTAVGTVTIVVT
jgi:hypothetical protein